MDPAYVRVIGKKMIVDIFLPEISIGSGINSSNTYRKLIPRIQKRYKFRGFFLAISTII